MFDPTVYDNVKVVLEGEIYELDFSKKISIINRRDIVDLASMSRTFMMAFKKYDSKSTHPFAEIHLHTNLHQFQKELLENDSQSVGCTLHVNFYIKLIHDDSEGKDIEKYLTGLWGQDMKLTQEIYYNYHLPNEKYNKISLLLQGMFHEDNVDDL